MGSEFHNLMPSKVRKLFLKFVEIDGKENPSGEDCLVFYFCICFVLQTHLEEKVCQCYD